MSEAETTPQSGAENLEAVAQSIRSSDEYKSLPPQPASMSLDQLAESTLMRVSAFVGECVGGDTFCGISVDEVRDENGVLLSLQLVACDSVNGEPVRRVAR